MRLFLSATHRPLRLLSVAIGLIATSSPALAQVGVPAAEPRVLEAAAAPISEAHSVALGLSPGGRPLWAWLRESSADGSLTLVRRYHRPPHSPGVLIEDPLTTDISGPPVVAASRFFHGYSTLVYPDLSGQLNVLRYANDGYTNSPGPQTLHEITGPVLNPALATDSYAQSVLVWAQPEIDAYAVYALSLQPWGSQGAPIRLGSVNSIEVPKPRVTYLGPHRFAVTWSQVDAATPFLRSVMLQAIDVGGGPNFNAHEVASGPVQGIGEPDIATSGWGQSLLVYSTQDTIRAHAIDQGLGSGGFSDLHWFAPQWPLPELRAPRISADSSETFAVAWADRDTYSWPERATIDGLWVDSRGMSLGPVSHLYEVEAAELALNAVVVDADADLWLGWTEGEAAAVNRSVMSRVIRGQSLVDLQIEADPQAGPVPPGWIAQLMLRIHNYGAPYQSEGVGSATGIELRVDGPMGGEFLLEPIPDGFECSQTAQQLHCVYHGELELNSVIPVWLAYRTPVTAGPHQLQLSINAHQSDLNPGNNQASLSLPLPDIEPDAFGFASALAVEPGSLIETDAVPITGIDSELTVRVENGEFNVSGGAWRTAEGRAGPGDSVRVRHYAAAGFDQSNVTVLSLGSVSGSFTSTTRVADRTPDGFGFAERSGVLRGSEQVSDSVQLVGFEAPAPITLRGGEYRINGGAWTALSAEVAPGSVVELRHSAASEFSTAVITELSVGGVIATFQSTTEAADSTPDAPTFVAAGGVATAAEVTSTEVILGGFNVPVALTVSGGSYSLNGAAFATAPTQVSAGDRLRLRHVSAAAANSSVSTQLTVGGQVASFSSTTGSADTTPNPFSFNDVANAKRNRQISSNTLTPSGYNTAVPISISGGQYSRNGSAWTSTPGSLSPGQTLRLRLTSSTAANTTTSLTVTVGGISDVWSVTTGN